MVRNDSSFLFCPFPSALFMHQSPASSQYHPCNLDHNRVIIIIIFASLLSRASRRRYHHHHYHHRHYHHHSATRRVVFGKVRNITRRYYCQIPLQAMLLFVYNRSQEIFGDAQETFISLRFEKQTLASAFVTIFSCPNIQPRLNSFEIN